MPSQHGRTEVHSDIDAHYGRLLAQHLNDEDAKDRDQEAVEQIEREIIAAIRSTGSYTWGPLPAQTIGHDEMVEHVDYFGLITAAQPKNHTVAGTLLNLIVVEAAEKVAIEFAPVVLKHRKALALRERAMQRAGV